MIPIPSWVTWFTMRHHPFRNGFIRLRSRRSSLRRWTTLLCLEELEARVTPSTFMVNSFRDAPLGNSSVPASTGSMILVNGQLVPEITLRSAVEQADNDPGGDTIVLQTGTYTLNGMDITG